MAEEEKNNQNEEEMSIEELIEENNILLNTLIDYLIEKKVVDEEEFLEKLNSVSDEVNKHNQEEDNKSNEGASCVEGESEIKEDDSEDKN